MLLLASAPLPTNSQTPMSPARIARAQAYLSKIDTAEKLARFAVLGYCRSVADTQGLPFNVRADIAQHPMTPVPNATSSSMVTASGSGVLDSQAGISPPAPVVVPIDGSGNGVANDPNYPPLTVQTRRVNAVCPADAVKFFQLPYLGEGPDWGDSFISLRVSNQPNGGGAASGVVGWLKANPGLAALGLFAAALAVGTAGKKRRGR